MRSLETAGLSPSMEDYLEAIYELQAQEQVARVRDIAQRVGVKRPTASGALKALAARNLVRHEAYGYATLTEEGRRLAEQVHQRHRAIVELLARVMRLPVEQAEAEACRLEHALSAEALARLTLLTQFLLEREEIKQAWEETLEQAELCEILPEVARAEATGEELTLDRLQPGWTGLITRVCGEGAIRRRLLDMGLRPGVTVEVERLAPLGDPMEIRILDYHLTLRRNEAAQIRVRVVEQPLADVAPGRRGKIVAVGGGRGRRWRWENEGLEPGAEIVVLGGRNGPPGRAGIAVRVGEHILVVPRRQAEDIRVQLL